MDILAALLSRIVRIVKIRTYVLYALLVVLFTNATSMQKQAIVEG